MENILVLATAITTTARQTPKTYRSLFHTCKRFSTILERRKHKILPRIYLQLFDEEIKKLPSMCDKLGVSSKNLEILCPL